METNNLIFIHLLTTLFEKGLKVLRNGLKRKNNIGSYGEGWKA